MTKCIAFILFLGLCNAQTGIPNSKFDVSKAVNEEVICYKPPLLETICLGYRLESCDKLAVSFNMTYDGKSLFSPISINAEDANQKICVSQYKNLIPNFDQLLKGCDVCLALKDGVVIQGAFAKFCPNLTLKCSAKPFEVSEDIDIPCVEMGNPCEATSCMACNKYSVCGWCAGALHPNTQKPGVCMSSVANQPYCETCSTGWMSKEAQCPSAPTAAKGAAGAKGGGDGEEGTGGEADDSDGGVEDATIVVGVLAVIVLALVGVVCYKKASKKGAMLSHHDQFKGHAQPIDLEVDEEIDTVDLHMGNTRIAVEHTTA